MKKSKVFLSAALVITIAAGAFAAKAHRHQGSLFCKPTSSGTCSTTAQYAIGTTFNYYCGSSSTACSTNTTVLTEVDNIGVE